MMTVEEILAALQAIVEQAKAEDDRPLTDEEAARYEELEGQLNMAQRSDQIRSRHNAYLTTIRPDVHVNVSNNEPVEERAFDQYLRTGVANQDLVEFRAQSEGTNTAGGYLVPTGFRAKLIERMKEFSGLANHVEEITTSEGNTLNYPTVDDTANVGEIVAEGGTFAAGADLVFGTRALTAYKYMAGGAGNLPLKVSWELLQDAAFDVRNFVANKLGERIARLQAVHFVTGTGSGQPQGIVTPFTTIGAIASNAAGPTYAELLATVLALDPAYRTGAKWLMNDATYGKIMALVDTTGRPLVNSQVQSISETVGEPRLLGYPVVIDQAMPSAAASAKFLLFGNLSEAYVIRRVKDITLVTLNELYAANGQTGFMSWARADGAVQNVNAAVVRTAAA